MHERVWCLFNVQWFISIGALFSLVPQVRTNGASRARHWSTGSRESVEKIQKWIWFVETKARKLRGWGGFVCLEKDRVPGLDQNAQRTDAADEVVRLVHGKVVAAVVAL
jgi:hypothetical protein